jgi:CheY-like chemotaxis protein
MKRVVLLIDPNPGRRYATADDLRGAGFIVTEAPDGLRALQRLCAVLPHAIVLELEMAGMTGRDVLAELKKDARLARIPVVALTAQAAIGERPAGVRSILQEPHDPQDLVYDLRRALETASA